MWTAQAVYLPGFDRPSMVILGIVFADDRCLLVSLRRIAEWY
jgi:hypothetical protein